MLLHVGAGNRGVGTTDRSFLFSPWRLRRLVRLADIGSVRGRLEYVGTGEVNGRSSLEMAHFTTGKNESL